MKFLITGKEVHKDKKGKYYTVKTGIWVDKSEYPASRLIELRKERGVGRAHKNTQRNCISKSNY